MKMANSPKLSYHCSVAVVWILAMDQNVKMSSSSFLFEWKSSYFFLFCFFFQVSCTQSQCSLLFPFRIIYRWNVQLRKKCSCFCPLFSVFFNRYINSSFSPFICHYGLAKIPCLFSFSPGKTHERTVCEMSLAFSSKAKCTNIWPSVQSVVLVVGPRISSSRCVRVAENQTIHRFEITYAMKT